MTNKNIGSAVGKVSIVTAGGILFLLLGILFFAVLLAPFILLTSYSLGWITFEWTVVLFLFFISYTCGGGSND